MKGKNTIPASGAEIIYYSSGSSILIFPLLRAAQDVSR